MSAEVLESLQLRRPEDVVLARQRARDVAQALGFDHGEQVRIATATSELARNAHRYAGGGRVVTAQTGDQMQVEVIDDGPGIANLDDIRAGRFVSQTGMGRGLAGVARLMDDLEIETAPGAGTHVRATKALPPGVRRPAGEVREELRRRSERSAYDEVIQQNEELLDALAELRARRDEMAALNRELDETNRGVVALYAELDDRSRELHVTLDAVEDAVALLDRDGVLRRANRAFGELVGSDPEVLVGRDVSDVLPQLALAPTAASGELGGLGLGGRILRARAHPIATSDPGQLAVTLTDTTAALELARQRVTRFAREREISLTLQRTLLPDTLPVHDRVTLAAWHVAAQNELIIGGDWYDAIEAEDGMWLVMGDVAGHGVAAAARAGQLRHSLRVYAHEGFAPPAAVTALNQLVLIGAAPRFATLSLSVIDHDASRLRLVPAGHVPPILLRRDDPPALLEEHRGAALGIPGGEYGEMPVALEAGDRVVLYTDGLVERPGEMLDVGFARLMASTSTTNELEDLSSSIRQTCIEPTVLRDDVALLLAQVG